MTNLVRIRGVDYPSQRAAAKALGLCESAVANALRRGQPDRAGLGRGNFKTPQKVTIRGKTYVSIKVAAACLGVTISAIYVAKKRGTLDSVGTTKRSNKV